MKKRWPAVLTLAWTAVASAADGPGDAALSFLRGLKNASSTFSVDDTAVSPDLPKDERADIAEALSRLGRHIRPDDLRVVEEKEDGDLAAVLISQVTNYDSSSVQIHALGMVKSGDKWRAAPVPSSFDSTGLSFRPGFLARAKQLEDWMLKARGEQFVRLKDNIFSMLADEMRKVKSPAELHSSTPEKLANDFLAALATRNLPVALAIAGGLEEPRPADWEETFQAISRVLRSPGSRQDKWRLLAAPDALRAIVQVETEGDERIVSVVALDPGNFAARPRPKVVHLPFVRSKSGLWRVRLPGEMLVPATQKASPGLEDDDEEFDTDILALFPKKLTEAYPPVREATSRAAAEAVLGALRTNSLIALCPRLDLTGQAEGSLDALGRAARLWQRFHQTDEMASPVLLDVHESEDDAVALVQLVSGKAPEEAQIETIFLRRSEGGWLANPGFSGSAGLAHVNVTISRDGSRVWAGLGTASEHVTVVDTTSLRRSSFLTPGFLAHDVGKAPDGRLWVTSGAEGVLAAGARRLEADRAPQHVTFGAGRVFVTSGDDGTLRVLAPDGRVVARRQVERGSYNVQYGGGRVVTPSLTHGTLTVLAADGTSLGVVRVAGSCHDACIFS